MDDGNRELEFLSTLGQGGFGTVYLANLHGRDRFVRRVAVKVLRTNADDPELIGRQRDEARLLGLISHQAIVQVVDLTEVQGQPAVVMEYVEGIDLGAVVRSLRGAGESVPPSAALDIVAVAASGLDAAYNGIAPGTNRPLHAIHRDIKPPNLLLTPRGGVKLLDFGIARADMEREGATGSAFFGTAAYMATEFWLQEPIGPAYDIYALGITLLEMLTGVTPERPPLEPARYLELRRSQLVGVDPDIAALVLAMVDFRADRRPRAADVQERAEALAATAPGEPLSRFARRVVPDLAAARAAALASQDLPTRVAVGRLDGTATPASPGPVATPTPWWYRQRAAALLGTALVGVVASALYAGAWTARAREEESVTPEPPTVSAPPAAAAVADLVLAPSEPVVEVAPVATSLPTPGGPPARAPARVAPAPEPAPLPSVPAVTETPPSATATATPAANRRRISISSAPLGAVVEVDGTPRGTTPIVGAELDDGSHRIRLTLDGVTVERGLDVGPDGAASLQYSFTDARWRSVYR